MRRELFRGRGNRADEDSDADTINDTDAASFMSTVSRTPSFEPDNTPTIRPVRNLGTNPQMSTTSLDSFTSVNTFDSTFSKRSAASTATSASSTSTYMPERPSTSRSTDSDTTDALFGTAKSKRQGMLPPRRSSTLQSQPNSGEDTPRGIHTRGLSHDSRLAGASLHRHPSNAEGGTRKRLPMSTLPEHKRSSLSSARVGEAAHGILYAMGTLQQPLEAFVASLAEAAGADEQHGKVERALYNANVQINELINELEAYEQRDDDAAVRKVIDASHSCVAAFRQVLGMLQGSIQEEAVPDVKYARTLLLMLYGSYVEIQSSYQKLQPLLVGRYIAPGTIKSRRSFLAHRDPAPHQPDTASTVHQQPMQTPRTENFSLPTPGLHASHPSVSSFDPDDTLASKFHAAATSALSVLPQIERDVRQTSSQSLQPTVSLKLREITMLCQSGVDFAKRLQKTRWDLISEGDVAEKRRAWEGGNRFTQVSDPSPEGAMTRRWER